MAYKDQMLATGQSWLINRGVERHNVSCRRIGDHAHVMNHGFDMNNLAAIVTKAEPGTGFSYRVQSSRSNVSCQVCDPDGGQG